MAKGIVFWLLLALCTAAIGLSLVALTGVGDSSPTVTVAPVANTADQAEQPPTEKIAVEQEQADEQPPVEQIVVGLRVGNEEYYVNGEPKRMAVPPSITEGRAMLPLRTVADAFGLTLSWEETDKKTLITTGDAQSIEIWVGKNIAVVNGLDTPIDAANPSIVPQICLNRTLVPLRFLAETLDCAIMWNDQKEITVVWPRGSASDSN